MTVPVAEHQDFLGLEVQVDHAQLLYAVEGAARNSHKELGVVHLDVKPENILVFSHPHLHVKEAASGGGGAQGIVS